MKNIISSIVILFFFQGIYAQSFVKPIEKISTIFGNDAIVTDTNGNEIKGKLSGGTLISGYLKSFTLKSTDGTKQKFKSEGVKLLKVKVSGVMKFDMITESLSSIKKIANTNFDELVNKEWLIFEQALINRKKDKPRLLQLLNPGFDSKIKVYVDPNANETTGVSLGGMNITGGEDKSYMVVKNNSKSFKVKKGKYKKTFIELFGDCAAMKENFGGSKTKFKDMAGHVFVYDQACK